MLAVDQRIVSLDVRGDWRLLKCEFQSSEDGIVKNEDKSRADLQETERV